MDAQAVRSMLKRAISTAETAKDWAAEHAMSQQYAADVIEGRREPGRKILDALGLEKVITYRKRNGTAQ